MKKILLMILAATALVSCSKSLSGGGGEVTGIRGRVVDEPAPYGMVLVVMIVALGAVYYGVTAWFLKHKLNLE